MSDQQAHARITLTVLVEAGVWGSDCTVKQVIDQAGREATDKLEQILSKHPNMRVVRKPRVEAILTNPKDD